MIIIHFKLSSAYFFFKSAWIQIIPEIFRYEIIEINLNKIIKLEYYTNKWMNYQNKVMHKLEYSILFWFLN